jgi:hypothetical protein
VTALADGTAISGAAVTDGARTATTDASGNYTLLNVPAGAYTVSASAQGYQAASQSAGVTAGQTATANFSLARWMWVEGITFTKVGRSIRVTVKTVWDKGAVSGATVGLEVSNATKKWTFTGASDSSGLAQFTIQKAPSGSYAAALSTLAASGYTWEAAKGTTTSTYTLQ